MIRDQLLKKPETIISRLWRHKNTDVQWKTETPSSSSRISFYKSQVTLENKNQFHSIYLRLITMDMQKNWMFNKTKLLPNLFRRYWIRRSPTVHYDEAFFQIDWIVYSFYCNAKSSMRTNVFISFWNVSAETFALYFYVFKIFYNKWFLSHFYFLSS